ncbi:MAG: carboxymuconolactone decarboxylase family protein [Pseudomonadota bacterium]
MARFPYLTEDDVAEEHRVLLSRGINLGKLYAHSPVGGRRLARVGGWIRNECELDPRLRELAILQVGFTTQTEYEWSHHIKIGKDFGVTDDDIRAIYEESAGEESGLDELARFVLRAAREMTRDVKMTDATFGFLSERLGNQGVMELIMVVSYYNSVVRFLQSTDIDVEDEYLIYLRQFPLPAE